MRFSTNAVAPLKRSKIFRFDSWTSHIATWIFAITKKRSSIPKWSTNLHWKLHLIFRSPSSCSEKWQGTSISVPPVQPWCGSSWCTHPRRWLGPYTISNSAGMIELLGNFEFEYDYTIIWPWLAHHFIEHFIHRWNPCRTVSQESGGSLRTRQPKSPGETGWNPLFKAL